MNNYWIKLLLISLLLVSESESCVKRFKEIKRKILAKFGHGSQQPQSQPAPLNVDPFKDFSKYSKRLISDFFIELEEDENGNYRIANLGDLPPILSQKLNTSSANITQMYESDLDIAKAEAQVSKQGNEANSLDLEMCGNISNYTNLYDLYPTAVPNGEPNKKEEVVLTDDDLIVRDEWGGNCKDSDWKRCSKIKKLLTLNPLCFAGVAKVDPNKTIRWIDFECQAKDPENIAAKYGGGPPYCLCNGWTVNRCQLICMSRCNKEILVSWDKLVLLQEVQMCPLSIITVVKKNSPNPCKWGVKKPDYVYK